MVTCLNSYLDKFKIRKSRMQGFWINILNKLTNVNKTMPNGILKRLENYFLKSKSNNIFCK